MKQLQQWMDEAKAKGIKKAFITFHYPVFARSGLGPIPGPDNPHKVIAAYAKDMEIVVFNGHVHTTEMFDVDGVKYLMLGGGGAEQDPILPGRTSIKLPADYPPDLYWKGQPPKEEYNYVLVDVKPGQKTKFTLNRFRPWSAEPFANRGAVQVNARKALRKGGHGDHAPDRSWPGGGRATRRDHPPDLRHGRRRGPARFVLRPLSRRTVRPFANAIVVLYAVSAMLGGIMYLDFRVDVRPTLSGPATGRYSGLFDLKEHFISIGVALCRPTGFAGGGRVTSEPARTRATLTSILAFIVWWGFLIGHVMNNIMGFGA